MREAFWIVVLCITFSPVVALIWVLVYAATIRAIHPLGGPSKGPRQEQED